MWACCQHTQHLARLQVRRRQQFENRQDEKKRRRKELYMKRARYALVVCGAALVVVRANLLYECTTCCTMCEQLTSVCIHTHHHAHASGNASTGHRRTTRWWAAPSPHPLQTCLATPMTSLQRYVLRDCLAVESCTHTVSCTTKTTGWRDSPPTQQVRACIALKACCGNKQNSTTTRSYARRVARFFASAPSQFPYLRG